jgi:glycolate oxidase FAD binding subunit
MIVQAIREAAASGHALRIRGNGTWLDAGRPVPDAGTVSLAEHRGIVEYVPGDLTLTARAGTPLSDIAAATREHGQWLPLEPWGSDAGSIGATISTATAGPHAYSIGLPRDQVLGLEFVTGRGDVIRAGGRVVKNVAGFDLARLVTGSWGTLGVITEVTVRLRALPERSRSLAVPVTATAERLNALAAALRALPFVPLASELVSAPLAKVLGLESRATLLLRVSGNEKSIAGQLDLLRAFGTPSDLDDGIWPRLRGARPMDGGHASWRWSQLPSSFGSTWTAAESAVPRESALVHGNPARGVVRVMARGGDAALASAATAFAGTIAIESLPAGAWALVPAPQNDVLSRSIRAKFDPSAVLNRGILGASAS